MTQRCIDAPAKINLGLEILGKRPDGFHEVRTILCKISLRDTLVFEPSRDGADHVSFEQESLIVPDEDNLILRALYAMRDAGAVIPHQHATVNKRIPAAAGLGGASSDAASTLLMFATELREVGADMESIAVGLGSDVPFFLGDHQIALASGRGERLLPLPAAGDEPWIVLATPDVNIPEKTRTMYGAIDPSLWSTGESVHGIADRLPALPATAPPNAFERALLRLHPELDAVRVDMVEAGAPFVALTGAGPTFYTLVASRALAEAVAGELRGAARAVVIAKLGSSTTGQ